MNKVIVIISLILLPLWSCTRRKPVQPIKDVFVSYQNIVYGADTEQQAMDVYLPLNRDTDGTPVFIFIHGGSWVQGTKNYFNGTGIDTFLTANGCAMVNMNYRLFPKYKYPAAIDDIGLVMDYIRRNAAAWHINGNRVCLVGRSVGSHLALLYAYSRNSDGRIRAVIDFFGPTDLADSSVAYGALAANVNSMLGDFADNKQAWYDASPVYHMNGAVPTIMFQGTADSTVPFRQAQILNDSLTRRAIPGMLVPWQGRGHGWAQDEWLQWRQVMLDWVKQFL